MTNEELVMQYQKGDDRALELLIEQNKDIMQTIAKKYCKLVPARLLDEAYSLELKKVARSYDFNQACFNDYLVSKLIRRFKQIKNNSECDKLVIQYQKGDIDVLSRIIELCTPSIKCVVKRYAHSTDITKSADDLFQVAAIEVIQLARKYEVTGEPPFTMGILTCISRTLHNYIKRGSWCKTVSYDINTGDNEDNTILDFLVSDADEYDRVIEDIDNKQLRNELENVMHNNLTLKEKNVIRLLYGWDTNEGYKIKDVAEVLHINSDMVNKHENSGLRKMREELINKPQYLKYKHELEVERISRKNRFLEFIC